LKWRQGVTLLWREGVSLRWYQGVNLSGFSSQTPDNDNILKQSATPNSNPLYIGNYQGIITDGILEIEETMKVNELVRLFKEEFSLCIQVFRRSGIIWLQTSMTAEWTLKKQNEHGKDLSPSQKVY
jgi:hypothetical protein